MMNGIINFIKKLFNGEDYKTKEQQKMEMQNYQNRYYYIYMSCPRH